MGSCRGGVSTKRLLLLCCLLPLAAVARTYHAREAPLPVAQVLVATGAAAASGRRAPVRHELSLDFYAKTCPGVDQIVDNVTVPWFRNDAAADPAVLCLFYHDCFVEGCDASILIALTASNGVGNAAARPTVEMDMEENRNLPQEAFDMVEMAKAAVEKACPGVVTCADVLALVAWDFVHLLHTHVSPIPPSGKKGINSSLHHTKTRAF
ncbi:hypothetical protein GUJ93_ZPchr0007g6004 [Zizania palustris]|uniref:Plant heme peroxidase family profile domain-containing protein n=1 Tax=Zizania palustris TaxID=103762 RepID=A0A8J5W571_ZIZPA|nr:hypothetical protein GUJ93_ZPchr0007g6004 [Zizania palustris]